MKRMLMILWSTILISLPPSAGATIIHVPEECGSIQAGIHAASDGDTVLVAPGTYYENIRFFGKSILVTSYLDEEHKPGAPEQTIINGSYPVHPESTAVVYFVDEEDAGAEIRGFTLTHNVVPDIADGSSLMSTAGRGIHCDPAGPTVRGNRIIGNSAECGGGIYHRSRPGQQLRLLENEIRWNAALSGGAIYTPGSCGEHGSDMLIENNIICNNTASTWGVLSIWWAQQSEIVLRGNYISGNIPAGIFTAKGHSTLLLERNVMVGNAGPALVVGDYVPGSDVILLNNTICDNGAGVSIQTANSATITNNIIANNTSGIEANCCELTISFNDVWNNAGQNYIGCEPGVGDISEDPLFVGGIPMDYHLTASSPCIDAGDPQSPLDPDGTRADMGAFYFNQACAVEDKALHQTLALRVWPTICAGRTQIKLDLPVRVGGAGLSIYDIRGRHIAELHAGPAGPGQFTIAWAGRNRQGDVVPSGVYVCRFSGGGQRAHSTLVRVR